MYYYESVERYLKDSGIDLESRKQEHLFRRYYLMAFLRTVGGFSLEKIGELFGKDHATVLNALKSVKSIGNYPKYFDVVQELEMMFPMNLPYIDPEMKGVNPDRISICLRTLETIYQTKTKRHGKI